MESGIGFSINREILALNSDVIFYVFNFPISNSTMMILLITLIFILFGVLIVKKYTIIPSRTQLMFENGI
jgi:F0F1-type ATP synthase membrane subunit a